MLITIPKSSSKLVDRYITIHANMLYFVRFPDVALKCCDMARKGYNVENEHLSAYDTRTIANFQTVLIQALIDLAFFRSSDPRYYPRTVIKCSLNRFCDYKD